MDNLELIDKCARLAGNAANLAKLLNVSSQTVSNWRGRREIPYKVTIRLRAFARLGPAEILDHLANGQRCMMQDDGELLWYQGNVNINQELDSLKKQLKQMAETLESIELHTEHRRQQDDIRFNTILEGLRNQAELLLQNKQDYNNKFDIIVDMFEYNLPGAKEYYNNAVNIQSLKLPCVPSKEPDACSSAPEVLVEPLSDGENKTNYEILDVTWSPDLQNAKQSEKQSEEEAESHPFSS